MTKRDQKRIAREYCNSLQRELVKNIDKFPDDWDGIQVRALAFMIQDPPHPVVKKAIARIKRSSVYCELSL